MQLLEDSTLRFRQQEHQSIHSCLLHLVSLSGENTGHLKIVPPEINCLSKKFSQRETGIHRDPKSTAASPPTF